MYVTPKSQVKSLECFKRRESHTDTKHYFDTYNISNFFCVCLHGVTFTGHCWQIWIYMTVSHWRFSETWDTEYVTKKRDINKGRLNYSGFSEPEVFTALKNSLSNLRQLWSSCVFATLVNFFCHTYWNFYIVFNITRYVTYHRCSSRGFSLSKCVLRILV